MDDIYLDKVIHGDTKAFRYFVNKYKDMAFSIAISIVKDNFTAEEVTQDAFLNAFNAMKKFNRQSKFSTWFYRIVVNEAFKRSKKVQNEVITYSDNPINEVADDSMLISLHETEQRFIIEKALEIISPRESLVLRLFYLQDESIKDVGKITGWSNSNVRVTLFRARKSMHKALKEILNFNNPL